MQSETFPLAAPSPRKTPWILRFLRRLFIFVFIFILLLIGTGFVIGYFYKDEVKEYIVGQLNKQLNTQVIVDGKDIDFTVLKNFPYASVDFKHVKALDAGESKNKDTLFKAGEISMQFNIMDIFRKNYHIKKVEISDVDLRVRIDKNGNDNYHFWKESSDTGTTAFSFALEKIVLNGIRLSYKDFKSRQSIDGVIKKSALSGEFSNAEYTLSSVSDLFVNYIKTDSLTFLRKKNIHTEFDLDIDNKISAYKIKSGKLKIEGLLFEVFGSIINSEKEPIVNMGVRGKDMDIKSVLSLIPDKYKGRTNDYESSGEFYFNATIQGSVAKGKYPGIIADFGIKNAEITQVKENIVLKNVNLNGHYSNGNKAESKPSMLTISPFSANIYKGAVTGELALRNLDHPSFDGKIKGDFNLETLQRFVKIDTIETITGNLTVDGVFSGDGKDLSTGNYNTITASGSLSVDAMNMKLKNNPLTFNDINGDFRFDNNDLAVNHLTGKIASSDFELKGFFRNIIGYAFKENQDITVEASLRSKNMDLNELLANKNTSSSSKNKYKLKFSEHIDANLNSEIEHLVFRKFDATDIHGIIRLKGKKMVLDPVTLSTMNGTITTSGLIDGSDSTEVLITCFSDVNGIDISKMFSEFENFGQTSITDKNIRGKATAKINFASVLTPELQMDPDKIYAGVDMTIENGEMLNVEAMKSLSRFIELKDLENIKFSTLKNQIEIKNQVISIPKMEVKSSAINIVASGTHTFNNEINYKIKLSLNELLSKKAKQAKKENDEFGEVADDGLGRTNIFLSMTGTIDNPVIKYDSKSAIQNVKQDLKVEKQTLKTILKDEFGLFKKDSTLTNKEKIKKEEETKFTINWDDASKKEVKKEIKPPKKPEDDDF
jgi:hypothetical protein